MKVEIHHGDVTGFSTQLLIVNLFEGVNNPGGATGAVDKALEGTISKAIRAGQIKGKLGETLSLATFGRIPAENVLIVGLGQAEKFGLEQARRAAASALWAAEKLSVNQMGTIVHGAGIGGIEHVDACEATITGSILASYRFDAYKSDEEKKKPRLERLSVIEHDETKIPAFTKAAERASVIAFSQNFARDLVSEPSNVMTPEEFASRVKQSGSQAGIKVEVFDGAWIREKGMNLIWGVGKGSHHPPRLVVMEHQGAGANDSWIGLIGKGVMFDSGGVSLKKPQGMESMKGDMAGGAAVAGAMLSLARLGIKKNVVGVIPAVMNAPGGSAQNPGDVIKGLDGPSVEIINTDAEGRLIMADALSYARKRGAAYLIDIATLTGASVVALGDKVAALFTKDKNMEELFTRNVPWTGERLWPMPMFDGYKKQLESVTAEIKNTGGRPAGAVTAAKFLEYFTADKPWAHIDMASKEATDKSYSCFRKGATGFGVRTLIRFAETWEG